MTQIEWSRTSVCLSRCYLSSVADSSTIDMISLARGCGGSRVFGHHGLGRGIASASIPAIHFQNFEAFHRKRLRSPRKTQKHTCEHVRFSLYIPGSGMMPHTKMSEQRRRRHAATCPAVDESYIRSRPNGRAANSIMRTQPTFQAGSFCSIRSLFVFMFFVLARMQQREPP
jgi:hypothetical protein